MRFQDVMRQGKWLNQCKYIVESVGEPQETQHGFCQALQVTDSVGITETLNYFYEYDGGEIAADFLGIQWLDVRWKKNSEYYQCKPAEAPKDVTPLNNDKPDWNKIALGKCRHGILCAFIQSGQFFDIDDGGECMSSKLRIVNNLAHFSMTGEINESSEREG